MKTFARNVIDKGTYYEAGQSYNLSEEDAKRIQERVPDAFGQTSHQAAPEAAKKDAKSESIPVPNV